MSDIWEGKAMPIYQIRLKEQLDQHWSAWFSGLMVTTRANGETLLTGEVVDQNGQIIPHTMNYAVAPAQAAMDTGEARLYVDAQLVQRYSRHFIYEGSIAQAPAPEGTPRKEKQA
jgi:hypothetical protein